MVKQKLSHILDKQSVNNRCSTRPVRRVGEMMDTAQIEDKRKKIRDDVNEQLWQNFQIFTLLI